MSAGLRCLLLLAALLLGGGGASAESGPAWAALTPQQQQVLSPLKKDWAQIEAHRRLKWLEVAARYPKLPAGEQQRLQARMTEWARMTPAQRSTARQQFQEVRNLPDEERQARWAAYQALAPEERARLAQNAKPAVRGAAAAETAASATPSAAGTAKRNIVRAPAPAPTKTVTPGVQQARPGATTTPITTRAAPPPHHQPGLPKIAATPGFVDRATLLPQRGPQGAAVRAAAASSPDKNETP
ncbi:DUF3106 domain-containing protein [Rubrivivax rivuli]|uniref:DUF3106 domain-containing protein n=1 Tax=Rubrivivax rivuli TaxID=1862385 RepID=UPI0013E3D6FC|nr:DUF3106 domain-containing protein [Rubrivivax rivuli]